MFEIIYPTPVSDKNSAKFLKKDVGRFDCFSISKVPPADGRVKQYIRVKESVTRLTSYHLNNNNYSTQNESLDILVLLILLINIVF